MQTIGVKMALKRLNFSYNLRLWRLQSL